MKANLKILTSRWFLLALIILLINDFWLKNLFHNGITGKLSDFAGIFVFSVFWTAFFPKKRKIVMVITALGFIYWKSPFSQPFINAWNSLLIFKIIRVVDFSDLFVLLILPFTILLFEAKEKIRFLKINPIIPLFICAFAFIATSQSKHDFRASFGKTYHFDYPKDTLIKRMEKLKYLKDHDGSELIINGYLPDDFIAYCVNDSGLVQYSAWIIIKNNPNQSIDLEVALTSENKYSDGVKEETVMKDQFEKDVINKIKSAG